MNILGSRRVNWPWVDAERSPAPCWRFIWNDWGASLSLLPYYHSHGQVPQLYRDGNCFYVRGDTVEPELMGILCEVASDLDAANDILASHATPVAVWLLNYAAGQLRKLQHLELIDQLVIIKWGVVEDLSPLRDCRSLRALYLGSVTLPNITTVASLERLEAIAVDCCHGLGGISVLAELSGLRVVKIARPGRASIRPIAELSQLETLHLWEAGDAVDFDYVFTGCSRLRHLACGSRSLSDLRYVERLEALETLDISGTSVRSLAPLASLKCLENLDISRCGDISSIEELLSLPKLKSVAMTDISVDDVAPMEQLPRLVSFAAPRSLENSELARIAEACSSLRHLELRGCKRLNDLSPLVGFRRLEALSVVGCGGPSDYAVLRELKRLKRALLRPQGDLANLDFLQDMQQLVELDLLASQNLVDVDGLHSLCSLELLRLSCGLKTADMLQSLRRLVALDLSNCLHLQDVNPLGKLHSLTFVSLKNCPIRKLWHADQPTSLRSLNVAGASLITLDGIESMGELRWLDVSGCEQLSSISSVASAASVLGINIADCPLVKGLQSVRALPKLVKLDMSGATDEALESLGNLPKLRDLDLRECESITNLLLIKHFEKLEGLGLDYCANLEDISALVALPELKVLNLSYCDHITDFSAIGRQKELQALSLDATGVKDLSFVTKLENLRSLSITACHAIKDLSPLRDRVRRGCELTIDERLDDQLTALYRDEV